jgi:hypothetical protein
MLTLLLIHHELTTKHSFAEVVWPLHPNWSWRLNGFYDFFWWFGIGIADCTGSTAALGEWIARGERG